jgi:hypothetical protein
VLLAIRLALPAGIVRQRNHERPEAKKEDVNVDKT